MSGLLPPNPLSYEGQVAVAYIAKPFAPTSSFINFNISTLWVDTTSMAAYILVGKALGVATWLPLGGGGGGGILTLTGNSGGPVSPILGNINVVGDGTLLNVTVGGPATLLGTIGGTIATTYDGNAGSATPAGHILNIIGNSGITTSGAGSTITITPDGTVPTSFVEDAGSATPSLGVLNIIGGTGITTSGAGNTVTITNTGSSLNWTTTSVNVATMTVKTGYFCISPGGALTLGLPAVSVLGDTIRISLNGATSWRITQGAGQQIIYGRTNTTLGAGGSLTSTFNGDSVEIVCMVANTIWVVQDSEGNLTTV